MILVDGTLLSLLHPLLSEGPRIEHVVVVGPGGISPLAGCRPEVHRYEDLVADGSTSFDCRSSSFALTVDDTTVPIVPTLHVDAWSLPHAAFMSGFSLLLTDRHMSLAASPR